MLKQIQLAVTACEPLVITDGSAESMAHQSLTYIPGSMLLGALAAHWIRSRKPVCPDADEVFQKFFLNGKVTWGHAYPSINGHACIPVPKSWKKPKNMPELPVEGLCAGNPLIVDALQLARKKENLERICADSNIPYSRAVALKTDFADRKGHYAPAIAMQWNMHVAIHEKRRMAADEQLFGYSSLAAQSTFASEIFCEDDIANELYSFLREVPHIQVGHARSAGYGKIAIDASPPENITERGLQRDPGKSATVFLLSDYIPSPSWAEPVEGFLAELESYWGRPLSISHHCAEFCMIAGFNGLWRLPRTSRPAIAKGSVFVLQAADAPGNSVTVPPSIGSGITEGYGRLWWNPPFLKEAIVRLKEPGARPPKPNNSSGSVSSELDVFSESDASAILMLVRLRAMRRQAKGQALSYFEQYDEQHLLKNIGATKLTANQVGNIRNMVVRTKQADWADVFASMCVTAEKKWTAGSAFCSFNKRTVLMKEVMHTRLGDVFVEHLAQNTCLELPGGAPSDKEKTQYKNLLHKEYLLVLLSRWEHALRVAKYGASDT